ncbi:MAG: beta-ketoacyl synthase N-terminal-like domain-containing protein [Brumimicrobium sp.]
MKNKCYINGLGIVSAQNTKEDFLKEIIEYKDTTQVPALKQNYKEYIPPALIRRMGKAVKNGVVASSNAMKDAVVNEIDGIIVGTGIGSAKDSEKFLESMIQYNEEYLTPTPFIQSTHNTIAGQIALGIESKAYNFTYVQAANSFQSALLDGLMQIQSEDKENILVGGMEEIGSFTQGLYRLVGFYKKVEEGEHSIFQPKSSGGVQGEGGAFMILSNQKQASTYAECVDVEMKNHIEEGKLKDFTLNFLKRNGLSTQDIDAVILGNNGDVKYDHIYEEMSAILEKSTSLYFKHLFGDFYSSSSIATWIASNILKNQEIPETLYHPNSSKRNPRTIENILIFNQTRGRDYSLILLKNV